MTALQDLHPDSDHPVLSGLGVIEDALDQILRDPVAPVALLASGDYATAVARLERTARRVEVVKLRMVAAADQAGTAQHAGFTGTDAWLAQQTTTSRPHAAREVGLARDLTSGSHDATARALDEGRVPREHAAVILNAGRQLPAGVSEEQRRAVEASLVEKARRFNPDQLRRAARRAIEAIEPDQTVVDAVLKKIIESMTAPRRMRETHTPHPLHRRRTRALREHRPQRRAT